MSGPPISSSNLASIPNRRIRKNIIVLKFGGTTVGATRDQQRIKLARQTVAQLIEAGTIAIPVFSAYRRGRSGSQSKLSVTDILERHQEYVSQHSSFEAGVEYIVHQLQQAHQGMISDLLLRDDQELVGQIDTEIEWLRNAIRMSCATYESTPSLNDMIITAGERLAVNIISAYLNRKHAEGAFPMQTAPVTAMELGIYTNNDFGNAAIDWTRAIDHSREVIVGQYLERKILPIITGFDGIYDPENEFREIMQTSPHEQHALDRRYAKVHRTSLGRGGSDLTATFLALALDAKYVGFCKETPGVLTGDDMLIGDAAQTVPKLNYDLATEAGNIYGRAVEPVRVGNIPIHIFDPARPETRTIISDIQMPPGLHIIERPIKAVNIHSKSISNEPGALLKFLERFAARGLNVEEIRHQRSGTDCIVRGDESKIQELVNSLNEQGFQSVAHFTWYLRVVGNVTEKLSADFNQFMQAFEPLTLATFQVDTKVVTATIARNRAGNREEELQRVESIIRQIHDRVIKSDRFESATTRPTPEQQTAHSGAFGDDI